MVDLFRQAPYQSRIEGNRLILTVADSGAKVKGPVMANSMDPSRRVADALSVSNVDFRRGQNGAGRIVLKFSGDGADADMRVEGTRVMVDVRNADIPANLAKHLDVSDFATPVQSIDAREQAGGTRLAINTGGGFSASAYQMGNEYVIEINPKKADDAALADSGSVSGRVGAPKKYTGKPATFNFQDVPVRTVLQLIAEESGLNVVASDTVTGNVTLRLINVPWDQALDVVLRAKGLDQRRDGGVVWVAPQKEIADYEQALEDARIAIEQRAPTVTEYIPINYGNAEDIAKLLTEQAKTSSSSNSGGGNQQRGFLSDRGSVSFDRRSNTLLLTDLPRKVDEIKKLVAVLDRPVDQVLIEARIVIANEDFARDIGARLGISGFNDGSKTLTTWGDTIGNALTTQGSVVSTDQNNQNAAAVAANAYANSLATYNAAVATCSTTAGCNVNGIAVPVYPLVTNQIPSIAHGLNVNLPVTGAAGSLAFSILRGGHALDLELSALQTEGRGEVISNPRVITSNQKQADIKQGDEIGYVTISGSSGGGGGGATANVQFKDVVLELKVTPTITHDNRVYMDLDITKDELKGFINVPNFGNVPQITKRQVTTAALVDSGQTVVIGGVYEFSKREDLTKVPFLGDLPGLGFLFRNKNHSANKAELLVFVTPKILEVKQRN
ncbi:MAG: type IV pilus secretin PilQ [Proteobacteria bacterium]|nr:type IV pilus secretin PilQ [Pseudomonadota bacterium]